MDDEQQGQPGQGDIIASRLAELEKNLNSVAGTLNTFATQQKTTAEAQQVSQRLAAAGDKVAAAERAYREARESGDVDAEIRANRELAAAVAEENRVRGEIDAWKARQANPPAQKLDDTELRKFRSRNTWFGTDQEMTQTSIAFAREIEGQGFLKGSPAYFSEVERRMRERYPDKLSASSPPVAGGGAGPGAPAQGQVRFTAEQLATWRSMGIDTSNPETLKSLAAGRQAAVARNILPSAPPGSLGRVVLER